VEKTVQSSAPTQQEIVVPRIISQVYNPVPAGLPRGALRTPKPFVRRNRRRHTATLVTEKTGLRRRFVDALQEDSEVLGFSSAGTGLWVVRAPIHAADRALSDLGWEA